MACIFYNKPCVILSVLFARNFMGISERKFRFFLRSKTIPFMPDRDIKGKRSLCGVCAMFCCACAEDYFMRNMA